MKIIRFAFVLSMVMSLLVSCKSDSKEVKKQSNDNTSQTATPVKTNGVSTSSLMAKAMSRPDIKVFTSATLSAGITDMLVNDDGPYTIFAPSNTAFKALPKADMNRFLELKNRLLLTGMLKNHIVAEDLSSAEILQTIRDKGSYQLETLSKIILTAQLTEDGNIQLKDKNGVTATLVRSDIVASNGTLHVIDAILGLEVK